MMKGRKWMYALAGVVPLSLAVFIYAQLMLRFGSGTPPQMQPAAVRTDTIEVDKSEQRMVLYRNGQPLREYSIALGASPEGTRPRKAMNALQQVITSSIGATPIRLHISACTSPTPMRKISSRPSSAAYHRAAIS